MSDPLYERYKEALRAGHVAVLRGRLDDAVTAYRVASEVAPERALPHTSLGGVLLDLGHAEEAVAEFHAALGISPQDEGALLGLSEALVRLGQPITAAETLDALAETLASAGRDADAVETLQRALVLEERVGRRRRYQRALRTLRMTTGDRASDEALGRALGLLDAAPAPDGSVQPEAGDVESVEEEPADGDTAPPGPAEGTASPDEAGEVPGAEGIGGAEETEAPPPIPAEPRMVGEMHVAEALAAVDAGDPAAALVGYLAAAHTLFDAGLLVAALDACREALQLAPDDVDVHLLYAAIFRARGWRDLATQRIVHLLRLADLDEDLESRARICAEVAAVHGDDERLVGLCG